MKTKIKELSLIVLCFAAFMGGRLLLLLSGKEAVNELGYFEAAMIGARQEPRLTSGIAYAYTESLSRLFRFTGNKPEAVVIYQLVLQTAVFFLLVLGCFFIFGKAAAGVCALAVSFFPQLISSVFEISPESYFLYGWAWTFLFVGLFYKNKRSIYLIFAGFLTGILCVRHFLGFLPVVFLLYGIIRRGKRKTVIWQLSVLLCFAAAGAFGTFVKYTQITGNTLEKQLIWWKAQLGVASPGRWQDVALWLPIWLIGTLSLGGVLQLLVNRIQKEKITKTDEIPEKVTEESRLKEGAVTEETGPKEEAVTGETEMTGNKEEEKKIKFIENPLPLPKKHVRKKMDFKLDDEKDDFDFEISENDDFDV